MARVYRARAVVLCLFLVAAPAAADELFSVHDSAGRLLGTVPIENTNLDRVTVAAGERTSLAVVEHGRFGSASLYLVAKGGVKELLRTSSEESLTPAFWSTDGARFALVRTSAPSWLIGGTPRLQFHGTLVVGDASGGLQTLDLGNDLARVLGWTATELVFTRALPGDFPEERPFALDLQSRAVRPLLEADHVYSLTLVEGRLYFARTAVAVGTVPEPNQRVELVQQDLATNAQQVVAVEHGALPSAIRMESRKLVWELDTTLTEHVLDPVSRVLETRAIPSLEVGARAAAYSASSLEMPYVHQRYDTPNDFAGGWACGPTSALMCILHFGRLGKWPVTVSVPYSHTSDYGAYVAYEYSAFGTTFNRSQKDASGNPAKGAYGWCTDGGLAVLSRMQDYAKRHDLSSDTDYSPTFAEIQTAIDAGKTVALSTKLSSSGHYIAVKGYTSDGRLVTNDPAGNKNEGYWNYHGENAVYTWSQVNSSSKWFITVYGTVTPTNKPPAGWLDGANCSDVFGWSQDPDEPSKSIAVHLYFGGPAGSGATGKPLQASQDRSDLCGAIGSCNHAFAMASPYSLYDGKDHPIYAYGIDSQGGAPAVLSGSPKTMNCPAEPPAGVKRHVSNPDVYAAWKFDAFQDQMTLTDTQLDAIPTAQPIPATPVMIRAEDHPEVWIVDEGYRRHVPSPEIAASWRLDLNAVQVKPLAEVEVYPVAPPIRARPLLVQGTGAAIYVIDDPLPVPEVVPEPDGGNPEPTPTTSPGMSVEAKAKDGCGCSGGATGLAPLAGLLALFALRRRS